MENFIIMNITKKYVELALCRFQAAKHSVAHAFAYEPNQVKLYQKCVFHYFQDSRRDRAPCPWQASRPLRALVSLVSLANFGRCVIGLENCVNELGNCVIALGNYVNGLGKCVIELENCAFPAVL